MYHLMKLPESQSIPAPYVSLQQFNSCNLQKHGKGTDAGADATEEDSTVEKVDQWIKYKYNKGGEQCHTEEVTEWEEVSGELMRLGRISAAAGEVYPDAGISSPARHIYRPAMRTITLSCREITWRFCRT
jgi:hypothetical protein